MTGGAVINTDNGYVFIKQPKEALLKDEYWMQNDCNAVIYRNSTTGTILEQNYQIQWCEKIGPMVEWFLQLTNVWGCIYFK